MITKNNIKLIHSLTKKKYRDIHHLFIAEGDKLVTDLIANKCNIKWIFAEKEWINHSDLSSYIEVTESTPEQLKKISQLTTPPSVIAICEIPNHNISAVSPLNDLILALDDVQNPGNLGTIIRLADWFGIPNIICSTNSADCYNPKVIQATMGAISRVKIYYCDLLEYIVLQKKNKIPVYGTTLNGNNIYQQKLENKGILVMGNEGNGISHQIQQLIDKKLYIPSFSTSDLQSESLNVSTATAIALSEFKRTSI